MEVRLFFLRSNPGLSAKERVKTRTCINSVLLLTALSSSEPAKLFWCRSNRQSHDKQGDWSFRLVRRCHERATPESQLDDQSNLSTIGPITSHSLARGPCITCSREENELSPDCWICELRHRSTSLIKAFLLMPDEMGNINFQRPRLRVWPYSSCCRSRSASASLQFLAAHWRLPDHALFAVRPVF